MKPVLKSILIAAGMVIIFLAARSVLFPEPANQSGNQSFTGYLILQEEGKFRIDKEEHVKFQVVGGEVRGLRIHLKAASGDLTFNDCHALVKDGSNFTDWFQVECRQLGGFEGKPVTYESYLVGAYAGISPPVVPAYSMYETLKKIAGSLGLPVPARTFVIYGQTRSPIYEFFCYEDEEKENKSTK